MSLSALLERVEGATGPDRDLDAAICEALHSSVCKPVHRGTHRGEPVWRHPDFGLIRCEPYTESVDAALALIGRVLPGWWVQHLGQNLAGWGVRIETQGLSIPLSNRLLIALTPALALCAALLAAMIGEEAKS